MCVWGGGGLRRFNTETEFIPGEKHIVRQPDHQQLILHDHEKGTEKYPEEVCVWGGGGGGTSQPATKPTRQCL